MEQALSMLDRRVSVAEDTLSGLRERVARLEAGQMYLMTTMEQRDARDASRLASVAEEMDDMQTAVTGAAERHQKITSDVETIRRFVDSRKETDTARIEARRYYRSILVPAAVALIAWAVTGSLDVVRILSGVR